MKNLIKMRLFNFVLIVFIFLIDISTILAQNCPTEIISGFGGSTTLINFSPNEAPFENATVNFFFAPGDIRNGDYQATKLYTTYWNINNGSNLFGPYTCKITFNGQSCTFYNGQPCTEGTEGCVFDTPDPISDCEQWIGECNILDPIWRTGNVGIGMEGNEATLLYLETPSNTISTGLSVTVSADEGYGIIAATTSQYGHAITALSNNGYAISATDTGPNGYAGYFIGRTKVDGTLEAERINVNNTLYSKQIEVLLPPFPPDYVFGQAYPLLPIDKLESYIKDNKHLPNIPSAKEMEETGKLNLGDMQFKLLEKVEELTLYIIELNNKVKALEKENELLKTKVK